MALTHAEHMTTRTAMFCRGEREIVLSCKAFHIYASSNKERLKHHTMAHIKNAANFTKNKKRGGAQAYIVSVLTRVLPMVERSKLRTTCCFG